MINNDLRRSFDFFKNPVEAGRAARALPLEWSQILGLHGLRAILLALGSYYSFLVLPERASPEIDPESYAFYTAIETIMSNIYSSPLFLFAIGFLSSLLMAFFLWQIGRVIGKSEVSWLDAQSALIRYMLVTAVLSTAITVLNNLTGIAIFALINFALAIYFMLNFIHVLRGVLELESFWQSLWVGFLSLLAMFGVAYFFSLFLLIGS